MKRRNFLIGTGSAAMGGSALLGSGAFSLVESHRDVTIQVAEDPDAYLGLDKCSTPNGSYAHPDDNGHLRIFMDDENPTIDGSPLGEGVNSNSITTFDRVFQICNQGKEEACVWIADSDDWPVVPDDEKEGGERRVEFYLEDDPGQSVIGEENAIQLRLGQCVCIGIRVRTFGLEDGDELLDALDNQIKIVADVDGDCFEEPEPECANLEAEFKCITTDNGVDNRNGHRIDVTNLGDAGTDFGVAILNSPDELSDIDARSIDADESKTVRGRDASFPLAGIVFWEDDCEEIPEATRVEDWRGIENAIGVNPDEFPWGEVSADRDRYDDVVEIENIEQFNEALDEDGEVEEVPTEGAFVAEIDYSGFDPEDADDIEQFLCG